MQRGSLGPRTPNGCGARLKWRPSDKNAPFFGAYNEVETKAKLLTQN